MIKWLLFNKSKKRDLDFVADRQKYWDWLDQRWGEFFQLQAFYQEKEKAWGLDVAVRQKVDQVLFEFSSLLTQGAVGCCEEGFRNRYHYALHTSEARWDQIQNSLQIQEINRMLKERL